MRVTNNMISNRVSYNMQTSLERFLNMQTQVSSGRRINKASDDPMGILRDLDYRAELSKIAQYRENIGQAQNYIQTYDSVLAELKDIVTTSKEVAIAMADGTYDNLAREASAEEIKSLLDQVMQLANSQNEGKYLFSGFRTDQKAMRATTNGVVYNGDNGRLNFQVDNSSDMTVNLLGSETFLKQLSILGEEADLDVGLTTDTLLANLHNGEGINQVPGTITITDQNLGISSTIDLSSATTIDDVINTINNQLTADGITDVTVGIGQEKNNLFFDTTRSGMISGVTSLNRINGGNGIDLSNGKIRISDGISTEFDVNFSGSNNIDDIITNFNTQVSAAGISNVTMQINAAQTGFEIIDSNGVPLGLTISEVDSYSSVASGLGIAGEINPTLIGGELEPMVSFKVDEVGGTTAFDLGILDEFTGDYVGSDLNPLLLTSSNITDLNGGMGFDLGEIKLWQGDLSRTINFDNPAIVTVQDILDTFNNSGLDITASINANGTGIQIANNDSTRSFTIEDVSQGRTAKDFGIFGSSDMMGSMIVLINALKNDDQEGTGLLLENLDASIQHLLNNRASVGAKGIRLEGTDTRLVDRDLTFTQRLSEVEDADMTQMVTDLATYENNYQAALIAAAKIIQPTLLDFLT